jgi:diacylglycerol O-acyltransferase
MPLYIAGARMVHCQAVLISYHGSSLNIAVQANTGLLEFGLTACRRVLSRRLTNWWSTCGRTARNRGAASG